MGIGPLPYARRWHADSCARHVRALLSHRLRCKSSDLCRHFHGCHPLEKYRSAVQRSFSGAWSAIGPPVPIGGLLCVHYFQSCSSPPSSRDLRWVRKSIGRRLTRLLGESPSYL